MFPSLLRCTEGRCWIAELSVVCMDKRCIVLLATNKSILRTGSCLQLMCGIMEYVTSAVAFICLRTNSIDIGVLLLASRQEHNQYSSSLTFVHVCRVGARHCYSDDQHNRLGSYRTPVRSD